MFTDVVGMFAISGFAHILVGLFVKCCCDLEHELTKNN